MDSTWPKLDLTWQRMRFHDTLAAVASGPMTVVMFEILP